MTTAATRNKVSQQNSMSPTHQRLGVIGRSDISFLFCFALSLSVVTSLPYAAGHVTHFPGTVFTDNLGHSFDTNNYLAYIHQSASGEWLFRNPMTVEQHRADFFNGEWLAIGKLSLLMHVSPAVGMNIARILCLISMCVAVYWLSSFGFGSVFIRRIALVACMAGGGFGWLAALHLLHIPLDSSYFLDLTNGNLFPFYWALKLPHFLISELFVVLGLCLFLCAERHRSTRYYTGAGVCYLFAGSCRPYDMLFLMASTGAFLVVCRLLHPNLQWQIVRRSIPIVMCMPLLAYYYWIFKIHPIFRWWSIPGRPAPSVWLLALGYGFTFVFLVLSVWRVKRWELGEFGRLMLCCLITAALSAYAHRLLHFSFQFATNLLIPLVMIVLVGLKPSVIWEEKRRWARTFILALLAVNSFTSVALAGQVFVLAMRGEFRVSAQSLEAYSWLDGHSDPNDVVFADFEIANQIPQYTHNRVFCGYDNAVNFDDKLRELQQFLDPKTSVEFREQLIQQNAIQFILLTPAEERAIELGGVIS